MRPSQLLALFLAALSNPLQAQMAARRSVEESFVLEWTKSFADYSTTNYSFSEISPSPLNGPGAVFEACPDGGFIVGGDRTVLKLNSRGEIQWTHFERPQVSDRDHGLYWHPLRGFPVSDGTYLISDQVGAYWPPAGIYGFNRDIQAIRLAADGHEISRVTFASEGDDHGSIKPLSGGGFMLFSTSNGWFYQAPTGLRRDSLNGNDYWNLALDSSFGKTWDGVFGGAGSQELVTVEEVMGGEFVLVGNSDAPSRGLNTDWWVIRVDAHGQKLWEKGFGGSFNDEARCVSRTGDGGCVVGGRISVGPCCPDPLAEDPQSRGTFLARLDSLGNTVWWKHATTNLITDLAPLADGGFLVAATDPLLPAHVRFTNWLVRMDGAGQPMWAKGFGPKPITTLRVLDQSIVISGEGWLTKLHRTTVRTGSPLVVLDGQPIGPAYVSVRGWLNSERTWAKGGELNLSTTLPGGHLFYSLDGSEPSRSGESTITLEKPARVRAVACNADFTSFVESDPKEIVLAAAPGGGVLTASTIFDPATRISNAELVAIPDDGWLFMHWERGWGDPLGDSFTEEETSRLTTSRISFVVEKAEAIRAVFGTQFQITAGDGGQVERSLGAELYSFGTQVRLTAVPSLGYYFLGWFGATESSESPISWRVLNPNQSLIAIFRPLPSNYVSLAIRLEGDGYVWKEPNLNLFTKGAKVTLSAAGSEFIRWSEDVEDAVANPVEVVMDKNRVITAHFAQPLRLELDPDFPQQIVDGYLKMRVIGARGTISIESSVDLKRWIQLSSFTNNGTMKLSEPVSNGSMRFYRVAQQ